jgi:predicted GIY-YIG superfamily endonuclease
MRFRRQAWLYIMANRLNGTIYVGVTNDLARRAWEHRTGAVPGFTKRYGLMRLVYAEPHETMPSAKSSRVVRQELAAGLAHSAHHVGQSELG